MLGGATILVVVQQSLSGTGEVSPLTHSAFALIFLSLMLMALGMLPGVIARKRNHPQAEAINVLAWVGLLLGIVPWVIALVWAYTKPIGTVVGGQERTQ